jgi:hypothetical protein
LPAGLDVEQPGMDQYKEKTPKEPTIREKINTYRFADHTPATCHSMNGHPYLALP